ncbi:MAG TPA: hypothetical protein VE134_00525, partial [Methanomicrobiales archaeon]|nr:hypothetical protein [Methanomicrobiales archaeon]
WNISVEEVNGTPMLAIRADRMVPEYHGLPIPIQEGTSPLPTTLPPSSEYSNETPVLMPVHLAVMVRWNGTIDTKDPLAGEPVFDPAGPFLPYTGDPRGYSGTRYTHTVPVYAGFASDRPASLLIQMRIEGSNSIWRGGWLTNRYEDHVIVDADSDRQGWLEGSGTLLVGGGVYY